MEHFENPDVTESRRFCPLGVYENLLANLPAWVFGVDERCRLVWSNNFCGQLLGFDPFELQRKEQGLVDLLGPDSREAVQEKISSSFKKKEDKFFSLDVTLIHKDRFSVYVGLKAFLFLEQEGPSSILFFMANHEEDRAQFERSRGNEERLVTLGTMTSEIAHEIKNSLVSIGALAHFLKKRSEKQQRQGLDLIEKEVQRLERLARSVNTIARPAKEGCEAQFDVLSLLQKSLCLLSPEIKKRNIKISLALSKQTRGLKVSSDMLMVAFVNLIRNAIAALPPKGKLWIKSQVGKEGLKLEFRNEMVKKKVSRQKELFRPLEEGGTSIGLPFSYKIVQNMGGKLSFKKDGNLAIFTIFLPKDLISEK